MIQFRLPQRLRHLRLINTKGPILLLATLIGVIGGLGAIGFYALLKLCLGFFLGKLAGVEPFGNEGIIPHYLFFLIPTMGGLVSGYIVYKFAPEAQGHGTDAMINTFHNKGGKVRKRVPLVKAISSILTISSGGSAGYEGPVAQIGSGMASLVSKFFHVSTKTRRILTLAGTAAGLGAIFKAPLGGAITSVEVLYKEDFESDAFLTSIIASVVAYATYCSVMGYEAVFSTLPKYLSENLWELLGYIVLGVLCAPVSWTYVKTFESVQKLFLKIPGPIYIRPAIGGLAVGIMFYGVPEIIAGGWNFLVDVMRTPDYSLKAAGILLMLAFMKMIATSFTVGSGGSGGIFGPSLFIGGMLGGAVGTALNYFFPAIIHHPGSFVLVGMGAFFSGAANAPIASVIMVCELTGNYNLLAPLMLASAIHIFLAQKWSIYGSQVKNKFSSRAHKYDINVDVLRGVIVGEVLKDINKSFLTVAPSDSIKSLEKLLSDTESDMFPVVEKQKIIGILDVHAIRKAIFDQSISSLVIVEDLMEKVTFLRKDMDLHTASQVFLRSGHQELPVISQETKEVFATLKSNEIMNAYDSCIKS